MIGPVYPYWVQWPTMLMALGIPILLVYEVASIRSGIGIKYACNYEGPVHNFVLLSGILLVVPAVILLIMFVVPLSYYTYTGNPGFLNCMMKNMVVTILDIVIHVS